MKIRKKEETAETISSFLLTQFMVRNFAPTIRPVSSTTAPSPTISRCETSPLLLCDFKIYPCDNEVGVSVLELGRKIIARKTYDPFVLKKDDIILSNKLSYFFHSSIQDANGRKCPDDVTAFVLSDLRVIFYTRIQINIIRCIIQNFHFMHLPVLYEVSRSDSSFLLRRYNIHSIYMKIQ